MTICYRDEGGGVMEDLHVDSIYENSIVFCDGFVYFSSAETDEHGEPIERKIPLEALVRIVY